MGVFRSVALVAVSVLCACQAPESGTLSPRLAFEVSADSGLTGARDFTVDHDGNVYIFDYEEYLIRKFNPSGTKTAEFGGTGADRGLFQHLMAIRAVDESLFALDAGSMTVFDLSGEIRFHHAFADTVVCDFPRLHPDGRWAAEWIISETAEYALTYRGETGIEQDRLASYALSEHFPGIQAGEMFFINRTQAPTYLYDFLAEGRLVWMASENLNVYVHGENEDIPIFQSESSPIPYPAEEIAVLEEQQAGLSAPLFINVPQFYQTAHHLLVDESGNIWLYIMSTERTGFIRLSPTGSETGFFTVESGFDLLSARITVAGGRMYFMSAGREETAIFYVDLP